MFELMILILGPGIATVFLAFLMVFLELGTEAFFIGLILAPIFFLTAKYGR